MNKYGKRGNIPRTSASYVPQACPKKTVCKSGYYSDVLPAVAFVIDKNIYREPH